MKTTTFPLSLTPFNRLFPLLAGLLLCCFTLQLSSQANLDEELILYNISNYAEDLQLSNQQLAKLDQINVEWNDEQSELMRLPEGAEWAALHQELVIKHSLAIHNVLTAEQSEQFEQLFMENQGGDIANRYNTQIPGLNMTTEQGALLFQLHYREDPPDREDYLLSIMTEEQKALYREFRGNDVDAITDQKKEELQMILVVFTAVNQEYVNKLREVRTRFNNYLDYTDQNQLNLMRRQRRDPLEPNFEQARQELAQKRERADVLAIGESLFEELSYAFSHYPRDYQFMDLLYENYSWDTLAAKKIVEKYQDQLTPFVPIIHEISREAKESIAIQFEPYADNEHRVSFGEELQGIFHFPEGALSYDFLETFFLMEPLELDDNQVKSNQNPFGLEAYPSPARTTQTIEFELPEAGQIVLEVIDQRGQILKTLQRGRLPAGIHRMDTDVSTYPDGIHFYRLTHPNGISTVKFVVER